MILLRLKYSGMQALRKPTADQLQMLDRTAAGTLETAIKRHLDAMPGHSYYKQAANTAEVRTEGGRTQVVIWKRGIHLQWKGGTVKPSGRVSEVTGKPIRHLLIPVKGGKLDTRSGISGERPSLIDLGLSRDEVRLIRKGGGTPLLVQVKDGEIVGKPLGMLVAHARINPHPEIMPTPGEMKAALQAGAEAGKKFLNLK